MMGAYMYCNKPSHVALARVEVTADDGSTSVETVEVALFRYAYKPTHSWDGEKYNQRWRFQSGAAACAAAWARTDKRMPKLGVFFNDDAGEVYAAGRKDANWVFLTHGKCEVLDDYADPAKAKLVRWVKLPKGLKEGVLPPPEMHERITPTMVLQVVRNPGQFHTFRARLVDEATGETMKSWWLLHNEEGLVKLALEHKVLAKLAPADAA